MKMQGISEIFSSIQGEGLFLGEHQVFIRFSKCNLKCLYCDTGSLKSKSFSLGSIIKKVKSLSGKKNLYHSVSITGGEPLLYKEDLKRLLPALKKAGYKIYLETNGTLFKELKEVIGLLNFISMDIKLPSSSETKEGLWDKHLEFLKTANSHLNLKDKKNLFVKIVITDKTNEPEFKEALKLIKKVDKSIPLVLQPVTPVNKIKKRVTLKKIFKFLEIAKKDLKKVLVIPQIHKIMGVR